MTYRQLMKMIEEMTDEQKDSDVTFFDNNDQDFYALSGLVFNEPPLETDVLDRDHPYFIGFEYVKEK
jgi:succinate dehydrogenase flavin-adding protein (antitoxin of CptAB toxin-antitoxin module)